MPIVKNFSFTLNTDAETFCTWLEDRNRWWVFDDVSYGVIGLAVDIQKAKREQLKTRTKFSFDAVIEIKGEDSSSEDSLDVRQRLFNDWVERKGIYREGVITVMTMPGTHAGKVDVSAICWDKAAIDAFSRILTKITEAYPEGRSQLQAAQEQQFIDNPYTPTANIRALKRGRRSDPDYDKAYQNIVNGMDREEAFEVYGAEKSPNYEPTPSDRRNFHRAMRDRKKKKSTN